MQDVICFRLAIYQWHLICIYRNRDNHDLPIYPCCLQQSGLVFLSDVSTSVADAGGIPAAARLHAPQPNPFNPTTTIRFSLPEATRVRLAVYDLAGRRVVTLADGHYGAGEFRQVWNGKDSAGRDVSSGVYFARLEAGVFMATGKMVLLR